MTVLLSTREVADFLKVNEKMVYTLVAEKGLPATKITGKWVFPKHLVEQWIETHTINYPQFPKATSSYERLLIITGSNDPLLDRTISLFNKFNKDFIAVFGNLGSMGGLQALRQNHCHIASSHLLQEDERDYNFEFAHSEFEKAPAVVNFCKREQGLIVQKGNPLGIRSVVDLGKKGIRIVNRPLSTGTRLLLDHELKKAGIKPKSITGYDIEKPGHLDVGLDVLSGQTDVAPGIRVVASLLGLDFVPLRWERFDLLIPKDIFFAKNIQLFLGVLHEPGFRSLFGPDCGYDLSSSGKVIFPAQEEENGEQSPE